MSDLVCHACKQPILVGQRCRQVGGVATRTRMYHERCAPAYAAPTTKPVPGENA